MGGEEELKQVITTADKNNGLLMDVSVSESTKIAISDSI